MRSVTWPTHARRTRHTPARKRAGAALRMGAPLGARAALAAMLAPLLLLPLASACTVSRHEAADLGRREAARVDRELPMVRDARVEGYVQALGDRIARRADPGVRYRFRVVDSENVNAFALPGGFVYVNRGLIEAADDMSELAGVLAHEVAHVVEGHSAKQIGRVRTANLGLGLAAVLLGGIPDPAVPAVQVGGAAAFSAYGRSAEREADRVAVDLLIRSGIDPRGFASFLEEMLEMRERRPSAVAQWFSTHPTMESRVEDVRAEIDRIPPSRLRGLDRDSGEFRAIKRRL